MKKLFTALSLIYSKLPGHTLFLTRSLLNLVTVLALLCGCTGTSADNTITSVPSTEAATDVTWNIITEPLLLDNESPSPEILSILFGAQIAVDELNVSGGINGSLISFCVDDAVSDFCLSYIDTTVECRTAQDNSLLLSINDITASENTSITSNRQEFFSKYQKMYGNEPNFYAIAAYDCIYELKQILEQETFSLPIE